jgi:alpha-L-fucosidase
MKMTRWLVLWALALGAVGAHAADDLSKMPAYQFPPEPVTTENSAHWQWMRDFYQREVSRPASANETAAQALVRAAHVKPTPEKLAYLDLELITFPHFGMSTVSGHQQGTGKEDPRSFNPVAFDAKEWVRFHQKIGARMLVFVAKHHDGYALWPSRLNDYCIRSSPWRDGKGDMVKEMADACRDGGLKFGLYISLWDEHDPRSIIPRNRLRAEQMTDEQRRTYQQYIEAQLHETLDGRYGEISELWLDGAGTNGAEDWNRIYEIVHHYQPRCLVAMCGFGVRWCGNESAVGDVVNWNVLPVLPDLRGLRWVPFHFSQLISKNLPRVTDDPAQLQGQELVFMPQEGDTRLLNGGWHWDGRGEPRSLEFLIDTYYASIGSGATLILSPAPDASGAFNAAQIDRLMEFRKWIDGSFENNLLRDARLTVTGADSSYDPNGLLLEKRTQPCIAQAGVKNLSIEAEWPAPRTFNNLAVEEYLESGQRVSSFDLAVWRDGKWVVVAESRTIGRKRVIPVGDVTAGKVRLRVTDARAEPALRFLGLYKALPYRASKRAFTESEYHAASPAPAGLKNGLRWSYFEDANNGFLPYQEMSGDLHTAKVKPEATGFDANPSNASRSVPNGRKRKEQFAMRFDGYFRAPGRAVYTFKVGAATGCRLYLDERQVIENDASNGKWQAGEVPLEAGLHRLTILTYFGSAGDPGLNFEVEWPGNAGGEGFGWDPSQRLLPLLYAEEPPPQ